MGTVPTAAKLAQMLRDLGAAMGQLTMQVTNLSTATNTSVHTAARATKLAVAQPILWNGKRGSVEARFFLAAFFNYARSEGEALNDWDPVHTQWMRNHIKWITVILNLMEDEAWTWALPYLEDLSQGGSPFTGNYDNFVALFNKRFAPDSTETAQDALKHIKQGKNSVAEYQARFDQFTSQTGWSDANHHTRFYNGLSEAIKDSLAIMDRPTGTLTELKKAAQVLDQRMRQHMAEKAGKSLHPTNNTTSRNSDAIEVDATRQQQPGKEVRNRKTYLAFMKGKCYGCGSTNHTKANRNHKQDICNHCRKVGHHSPVCQSKNLGKPAAAKAAATEQEQPTPSTLMPKGKASVSTTTPVPAKDSKGQADLLAQLMAQIKEQSAQIEALKASF